MPVPRGTQFNDTSRPSSSYTHLVKRVLKLLPCVDTSTLKTPLFQPEVSCFMANYGNNNYGTIMIGLTVAYY